VASQPPFGEVKTEKELKKFVNVMAEVGAGSLDGFGD